MVSWERCFVLQVFWRDTFLPCIQRLWTTPQSAPLQSQTLPNESHTTSQTNPNPIINTRRGVPINLHAAQAPAHALGRLHPHRPAPGAPPTLDQPTRNRTKRSLRNRNHLHTPQKRSRRRHMEKPLPQKQETKRTQRTNLVEVRARKEGHLVQRVEKLARNTCTLSHHCGQPHTQRVRRGPAQKVATVHKHPIARHPTIIGFATSRSKGSGCRCVHVRPKRFSLHLFCTCLRPAF